MISRLFRAHVLFCLEWARAYRLDMKFLALMSFFTLFPASLITHEQIIPTPVGITAEIAVGTADNFIVAGTNASSAWARKFSADGKTLWEYTSDAVPRTYPARIPDYSGVAPMSDGSTFLCGKLPHDPSSTESSALLTHVDAGGKRLSETTLSPKTQAGNRARYSVFHSCLGSGSQVILQGTVLRVAGGAAPGNATKWLWFMSMDEKGHVAWQQETSNAVLCRLGKCVGTNGPRIVLL